VYKGPRRVGGLDGGASGFAFSRSLTGAKARGECTGGGSEGAVTGKGGCASTKAAELI